MEAIVESMSRTISTSTSIILLPFAISWWWLLWTTTGRGRCWCCCCCCVWNRKLNVFHWTFCCHIRNQNLNVLFPCNTTSTVTVTVTVTTSNTTAATTTTSSRWSPWTRVHMVNGNLNIILMDMKYRGAGVAQFCRDSAKEHIAYGTKEKNCDEQRLASRSKTVAH
jgi:hypothetical protein